MDETTLQKAIKYLAGKPVKFWVKYSILFLLFIIIANIFMTYTIISVNIIRHDSIQESVELTGSSPANKNEKLFTIGNIALIRRDSFSIQARAGSFQTNKTLSNMPIIGIASTSINIYKYKEVEKYSGDSLGCLTFDNLKDLLSSYNCGKPEKLVRYILPTSDLQQSWGNITVATMTDGYPPIYSIKPFKGGVLGIIQQPQSDKDIRKLLFYVDSNGRKINYDIPIEIDRLDISSLSLITDSTSETTDQFLIVSRRGEIYLGAISASGVSYRKATISQKFNPIFDTLVCNLLGETTYCYYGPGSRPHDSDQESIHRKESNRGFIEIINISNKSTNQKIYSLSIPLGLDHLYVSQAKIVYATSKNSDYEKYLYQINLSGNLAVPRPILADINAISSGSGLFYIQNNTLYKLNDVSNESYAVFSSPHLRLSNVISIGNDIFFNTFINDTPGQKIHTFKLLDTPNNIPIGKRLVDLLPIYVEGATLDVDYKDKLIRVRVFAPSIIDKINNRLLYNEIDFNTNRQIIENQLALLGVTQKEYKIIFSR